MFHFMKHSDTYVTCSAHFLSINYIKAISWTIRVVYFHLLTYLLKKWINSQISLKPNKITCDGKMAKNICVPFLKSIPKDTVDCSLALVRNKLPISIDWHLPVIPKYCEMSINRNLTSIRIDSHFSKNDFTWCWYFTVDSIRIQLPNVN